MSLAYFYDKVYSPPTKTVFLVKPTEYISITTKHINPEN